MKTNKRSNEWDKALQAVLLEKGLKIAGAWKLLVLHPRFSKLSRVTLYRWRFMLDAEVPDRAHEALKIIRVQPVISASDQTIKEWTGKLTKLDEQLGTMRTDLKMMITQLSF